MLKRGIDEQMPQEVCAPPGKSSEWKLHGCLEREGLKGLAYWYAGLTSVVVR